MLNNNRNILTDTYIENTTFDSLIKTILPAPDNYNAFIDFFKQYNSKKIDNHNTWVFAGNASSGKNTIIDLLSKLGGKITPLESLFDGNLYISEGEPDNIDLSHIDLLIVYDYDSASDALKKSVQAYVYHGFHFQENTRIPPLIILVTNTENINDSLYCRMTCIHFNMKFVDNPINENEVLRQPIGCLKQFFTHIKNTGEHLTWMESAEKMTFNTEPDEEDDSIISEIAIEYTDICTQTIDREWYECKRFIIPTGLCVILCVGYITK